MKKYDVCKYFNFTVMVFKSPTVLDIKKYFTTYIGLPAYSTCVSTRNVHRLTNEDYLYNGTHMYR